MKTGYRGTFVISWLQTEVDGLVGAPRAALGAGSSWRWRGEAVRVDGPREVLLLEHASGEADLRRRAARAVHKLLGAAIDPTRKPQQNDVDAEALNIGFEVTDGRRSYTATLIEAERGGVPLLLFVGEMPAAGQELWVVRTNLRNGRVNRHLDQSTGVICFTPGTRIRTGNGEVAVEELREGDPIQTMDDGQQRILWIGRRRISGARLFALPELRPVRIRSGALGEERPNGDLIVSPRHRVLLRGPRAQALFNTPEVLAAAGDLIDDRRVHVDHSMREVVYYHLLLERHQVVWANGVETESFHPASTALETVEPAQRARLLERHPGLDRDPLAYGEFARRNISRSEAAILGAMAA
jgi:hypothetical protein